MADQLQIRKALKSRKPTFRAQDSHKKVRVKNRWRKPRGSDSKMRQRFRSYARVVKTGWQSPKSVRGLDRTGLEIVYVAKESDIQSIDAKKQGAMISGKLGLKKKLILLNILEEKNITVLNVKDVKQWKLEKEKKRAELKQQKTAKNKQKEEKKKKVVEKKEKKKDLSETISEEEKKAQEKKEKDKILTHTQ